MWKKLTCFKDIRRGVAILGFGSRNETSLQTWFRIYKIQYSLLMRTLYCPSKCLNLRENGFDSVEKSANASSGTEQSILQKQECAKKLSKALECSVEVAEDIVSKESDLYVNDIHDVIRRIEYLKKKQISVESIIRDRWILYLDINTLWQYFALIHTWGLDQQYFQDCLVFCKLKYTDLYLLTRKFQREKKIVPYGNRLLYLAEFLNCTIRDVSLRLLPYPSLLRRDINMIRSSLNAYREFGIDNKDILNDIICLQVTSSKIQERLTTAKQKNLERLKPWMARWKAEDFEKYLKSHENEVLAYHPFDSREEFLCNKLELSKCELESLVKKHKFLVMGNGKKLANKLNFLLSVGCTPQDILMHIYIFNASLQSMQNRYAELQKSSVSKIDASAFTVNKKSFKALTQRKSKNDEISFSV